MGYDDMASRISLFVFIDALGWEILSQHAFLNDVLTTRAPVESIFGYSSTCDPTIITGQMPRAHGHFSFFLYDPAHSPFHLCRLLSVLPASVTRRGRIRRLMSRLIGRLYGYTGYFQIYNMPFDRIHLFDYSEKRDIYQPGGINSGAPTIFDYLRERQIPFLLSNWRRSETDNLAELHRHLAAGQIRFAYLYMAAMDATLHDDGSPSPRVSAKIAWYARQVDELYTQARAQYDEVRLYVFSDHGMTNVVRTVDVMRHITALPLRFGVDYAAIYDSTMARFWFLTPPAREAITAALSAIPEGHIMTAEELAGYGCDFPDQRYGQLFFLLEPGNLLCPSFMGEKPLAGMHGYDPTHRDSLASYLTNCTATRIPRRLDDFYALMREEIDLVAPVETDGPATPRLPEGG